MLLDATVLDVNKGCAICVLSMMLPRLNLMMKGTLKDILMTQKNPK